jgi:hypothetical protein
MSVVYLAEGKGEQTCISPSVERRLQLLGSGAQRSRKPGAPAAHALARRVGRR